MAGTAKVTGQGRQVLILTQPGDVHAEEVQGLLAARGADVVVFDPAEFPARALLTAAYGPGGLHHRVLHTAERRIGLDALDALWFRRPRQPQAHPEVRPPSVREHIEEECELLTSDLWDGLDCLMVPGPRSAVQLAQRKPSQLALAGRLGFALPPTLVTNDPEEFMDFWDFYQGRVITKPLGRPWVRHEGQGWLRMTEFATTRDIGYADALRFCPLIIQAYVPKRLELRVTVVGERLFAAEIHSQRSNRARHDWRRYDQGTTRYAVHGLPPDVEDRCRRLVARLGLRYGAIDLVLTPDGRYVFLEINPSGQWLWIEDATGMPISEAVCDLLLSTAGGASAFDQGPEAAPWQAPDEPDTRSVEDVHCER
ncbi:MvdC/MvdD family ATP grasp protein [Streptomyces sp. WSLK1-3]|uniref:MvdC/MvdD family ATP grasp protein n=1 Tax=Streptomyces sp. WSLK1-3 TaxID=3375475 RepID=UPI00378FF5E3